MPITLKAIHPSDYAVFHALLKAGFEAAGDAAGALVTLEFAVQQMQEWAAGERMLCDRFQRGVYLDGKLIGSGSLYKNADGHWEISYFINDAHKGNGYTAQVVQELVKLAHVIDPDLIVTANYSKQKPATGPIFQKLGFKLMGEDGAGNWCVALARPTDPLPVGLRVIVEADIAWIYGLQKDRDAAMMAGIAGDVVAETKFTEVLKADIATHKGAPDIFIITWMGQRAGYSEIITTNDGQQIVSYWIERSFWGKGIASRALALMLQRMPKPMKEKPVFARVADGNPASVRVLEKLGFIAFGRNSFHSAMHGGDVQQTLFQRL